jgi:hypothetical protein
MQYKPGRVVLTPSFRLLVRSKLRKRGDVEPAENPRHPAPSTTTTSVSSPQLAQGQHPTIIVTLAEPPMSNLYQPTTAWNYPAAHFLYSTQDQVLENFPTFLF